MREIQEPSVLKKMSVKELNALAQELREEIIRVVSEQGGHLASNLGIVELTLALYYVFDAPDDRILFDVGHQTYAQKLLTGRLKEFQKLRARDGASGFPQMEESEYDSFAAGHASTAISAALWMGPGTSFSRRVASHDTKPSTTMMTHMVTTVFVTSSGPMENRILLVCSIISLSHLNSYRLPTPDFFPFASCSADSSARCPPATGPQPCR